MSIRYELRLTAICEECHCEWTPTAYASLDNTYQIIPVECPKCAEEKREAGNIIRYFPYEIVNLLE